MNRRINRRMNGFTLLEILVVLVLLGVLSGLVANTLLVGRRSLASAERYAQRLDEVRAAQNFLRQAVQRILPLQQGTGDARAVFDGGPQSLRFAATLPANLGGGIEWHILEVLDDGRGQALRIRFETPAAQAWGEPQWLLRDIRSLHLTYRGLGADGKSTAWLERWPWPRRLPQQVGIAIDATGPVPWVAQVIALRLDLSGNLEAP
jgi:general secretion pathway protein J